MRIQGIGETVARLSHGFAEAVCSLDAHPLNRTGCELKLSRLIVRVSQVFRVLRLSELRIGNDVVFREAARKYGRRSDGEARGQSIGNAVAPVAKNALGRP